MDTEQRHASIKVERLLDKKIPSIWPEFGIKGKLIIWFIFVFSIFLITILVLWFSVQAVVQTSSAIISKNYTISSAIKKITESFLEMESHQKKYILLGTPNYLQYYYEARNIFEENLNQVVRLNACGHHIPDEWYMVRDAYSEYPDAAVIAAYLERKTRDPEKVNTFWIPDVEINAWIEKLVAAEKLNGAEIKNAILDLNQKVHFSRRNVMIGMILFISVGVLGLSYLAYSIVRPLNALMGGIRALSSDERHPPLEIRGNDEFGELTKAFNQMSHRLRREEDMRSDFISMLSHEIRTPLTSIRESVNMMREEVMGPVTQRQRRLLEIAGEEIVRLTDLLTHLMQASRLESSLLHVSLDPVDPHELIMESVKRIHPLAQAKHIRLEIQMPHQMPAIVGNFSQLQQVMLNYLSNAVKFSDSDTCVTVGVRYNSSETKADFFVSDQGPGILEEDQEFLFNKYYRGQRERDRLEGAGLGLSIVKNIVDSHHGTVWLESCVGAGSVFGFTLPCVNDSQFGLLDREE